jgi:uncharacterized protein (TIGR03083 family)
MRLDEHLDHLQKHGEGLGAAAAAAGLDARVPTCPEWQVRDLLAHIGRVHRWAAGFVSEQRAEPPGDDAFAQVPSDDGLLDWYAVGHAALIDTLRSAPADIECWTFLPAPSPLEFWARRQAHETTVHHIDVAGAAGTATDVDVDPRLAVDGLDELLLGFFARTRGRLVADPPLTLGVEATDGAAGDAWTVAVRPNDREITRGVARGDCLVRGRAADLYAFLWNRRDDDALTISGDRKVLDVWREKARITWS